MALEEKNLSKTLNSIFMYSVTLIGFNIALKKGVKAHPKEIVVRGQTFPIFQKIDKWSSISHIAHHTHAYTNYISNKPTLVTSEEEKSIRIFFLWGFVGFLMIFFFGFCDIINANVQFGTRHFPVWNHKPFSQVTRRSGKKVSFGRQSAKLQSYSIIYRRIIAL